MNKPKCPYCGGEMMYYWDNNPMKPEERKDAIQRRINVGDAMVCI